MTAQEFEIWCDDWHHKQRSRTLLMGILNATPDSFSDGGEFLSIEKAKVRVQSMLNEGVDIIDVGGESSRPGAASISDDEELSRVLPIIALIREQSGCLISIDTVKPSVMTAAAEAGAGLINDISSLESEAALSTATKLALPVCLMHKQGTPQTMQQKPHYSQGLLSELKSFFKTAILRCQEAGIAKERLILDPGFGFGKNDAHNLQLLKNLAQLTAMDAPLLLGVSRKRTLGAITGAPVNKRAPAGVAIAAHAVNQGVAILRTHDLWQTKQAILMMQAIRQDYDCTMERD